MAIDIKLQEHAIVTERGHDDHSRFANFELLMRNLVSKSISIPRDPAIIDEMKQSILILSMKDKFNETNDIFIKNTIDTFYESINELAKNNRCIEWDLFHIKLFVEDFYINPRKTNSNDE